MKNNKSGIFAIIGIIVTALAAAAGAAYFIYRIVNKHCICDDECDECYEFDCSDCTAGDCENCPSDAGCDADCADSADCTDCADEAAETDAE